MRTQQRIDRSAVDHAVRDFASRLSSDLDVALGMLDGGKRRDVAAARELLAGVLAELSAAAERPVTVVPDPRDVRWARRALRRLATPRMTRAESEAWLRRQLDTLGGAA